MTPQKESKGGNKRDTDLVSATYQSSEFGMQKERFTLQHYLPYCVTPINEIF